MTAMNRIRQAAIDSGWTIKARRGQRYQLGNRIGIWDRDIFVIGRCDRKLLDGTPVTEPEHSISVWYRRDGAVAHASGYTYTVPEVIYHQGILGTIKEKNKAGRIVIALINQTADIPGSPYN
jgi:hypothetical protein